MVIMVYTFIQLSNSQFVGIPGEVGDAGFSGKFLHNLRVIRIKNL
jgi:hypothetical protein